MRGVTMESDDDARQDIVTYLLWNKRFDEALALVERWPSWPVDAVGLWIVLECYFSSRRREAVPILEHFLRQSTFPREDDVAHIQKMLVEAKAFPG